MHLSVAICTWNRANLLDATLTKLQKLTAPANLSWELLVVNNNCADRTDEVIERHQRHLPIRRLHESQQGLSHARNRAVEAAQGELILFTDDDIEPGADWLTRYVDAAQSYPQDAFFGGPIEARFESSPPQWLSEGWDYFHGVYGQRDLGEEPFQVDRHTLPCGANFAVRAELAKKYPFDPQFGRVKDAHVLGEEFVLFFRLMSQGHPGRWLPRASVKHCIPENHMSVRYVYQRLHGQGLLEVLLALRPTPRPSLRLWRDVLLWEAKWRMRHRRQRPDRWVHHLVRASVLRGQLAGCRALRRASPELLSLRSVVA